jgi:hypothetical protein
MTLSISDLCPCAIQSRPFGLPYGYFLRHRGMSPVKGGKEERGRTSKLTNLSFVSSVSCAQANGHGHLSSHGLTYFWSSSRCRTAASQRAFSVGTHGRGGCFARRDKCPPGGCPRRHPAARRAASTPRGVGGCGTHCGGTSSRRSREADRGVALGWPRRGCYVVHDGVVAARAGDGRRAGRRRRGRPARGQTRGARAARRELGVLGGRRGGWQECERVSRRQR